MKYAQITAHLLVTSFLLSLIAGTTVQAQKTGFTISPPIIEKEVKPGDTLKETISITNDGEKTVFANIAFEDFYIDNNGEMESITKEDLEKDPELKNYSMASWMQVPQASTAIAKGETTKITVTIQIPSNANPGGHYGLITFAPSETKLTAAESAVQTRGVVGAMVLLSLPGDFSKTGSIRNFTTGTYNEETKTFARKSLYWNQGIFERTTMSFGFEFFNSAKTHYRPQGNIEIQNLFGKKIDQITIEPTRVFPGTQRGIYTSYTKELTPGIYRAKLGVLDAAGNSYQAGTFFFVFPLSVLGVIAFVVFITWLIAYLNGKRIERKYKKAGIELKS